MELHFIADYAQLLADALTHEGVQFDDGIRQNDPVAFIAACKEYRFRRISRIARQVLLSQQLRGSTAYRSHLAAIDNLINLTENGGDLSPFQTNRISNFDNNDLLLTDWGIHHLHLGNLPPGQHSSLRSGDLLFCVFHADVALFLGIFDHNSFPNVELLEILEDNWPKYLDRFTIAGGIQLDHPTTIDEMRFARQNNIQAIVQLQSGRVLGPAFGGYSTAGTSMFCLLEADQEAKLLRSAEDYVKANENPLRKALAIGDDIDPKLKRLSETEILIGSDLSQNTFSIPVQRHH